MLLEQSRTSDAQYRIYIGTLIHTPTLGNVAVRENTAIGVLPNGIIDFIESIPASDDAEQPGSAIWLSKIARRHNWTTSNIILEDTTDEYLVPLQACENEKLTEVQKIAPWNRRRQNPRRRKFLFPGFVDTHTHASQYPNTGIFGSSTLLDWLKTYTFPLESSFGNDEPTTEATASNAHRSKAPSKAHNIYNRVVARTLSYGTTTSAYYATIHVPATNLLADICLARGQRALIGRVCMDRLAPEHYQDHTADDAVRKTQAVMQHIETIEPLSSLKPEQVRLLRGVITPRFAPSCNEDTLKALGMLQKATKAPVQTHISENFSEIKLVRELFPESQHYTGVYDDAGLLSDRTILAHGVHLTVDEIELIKLREAGISHCPISNTCLASGTARVRTLLDKGIKVGLGTDMSGGYSPSILEVARKAIECSRHVAMELENRGEEEEKEKAKLSVEEVLWLATVGGAEVVGLGDKIGRFEVGMCWDAQLISLAVVGDDLGGVEEDVGPVDLFGGESVKNMLAKWLYAGDDRNVEKVWVGGRLVHDRTKPSI